MSKSDFFENALLLHVFNNSAIANVGDATGLPAAGTAGSLYVALHTASPAEGGNQSSNEAAFTNYARVAVARSGAGWTVSGSSASNAADILFASNGGSAQTVTHVSIGVSSSGATSMLYYEALSESREILNGYQLRIAAGALTVGES